MKHLKNALAALATVIAVGLAVTGGVAFGDYMTSAGLRVIENPVSNGNLILNVNKGGVKTNALTVTGSTAVVTLDQPLPLASGGTNKAATAVNGGLVWSDADSLEVTSAGTASQWVLSGGAGAPTMTNTTTTAKMIDLTADSIGLTIQGAVGQTGTAFVVENSGGTDQFTVGANGTTFINNATTINGHVSVTTLQTSGAAQITAPYLYTVNGGGGANTCDNLCFNSPPSGANASSGLCLAGWLSTSARANTTATTSCAASTGNLRCLCAAYP